ncbi:MAG: alpha-L-fucosidase [Planctomycetota bacterium]|nr:alpha-L-fucosidase [Planctomycetota bacterium]
MQDSIPADQERIRWWQEARFGMFVHWGLYTIDGLSCWKMHDMGIPTREYLANYEHRFNPTQFDARAIAQLAADAGCKYVVMGTRHHEGYCLWNTATTAFSSVRMTPKRDFIAEYVQAAREAGLKVGFYYSLLDWRYKAYWDGPRNNPQGWKKFVDYVHSQVKELMSLYGKIDILWYDGAWPPGFYDDPRFWGFLATDEQVAEAWRSKELNAMVRRLQPDIILNNRSYLPEDFGTPEQTVLPESRPWELCDTMGDLWSADSRDLNRKTPRKIVARLIKAVANGGNMLLNVGLKADGGIQGWQAKIMARIGDWMKKHGEAIYGCSGVPQRPFIGGGLAPWLATQKDGFVYLLLVRYPGRAFGIANFHDYRLESAELLDTGDRLEIVHEATRDIIRGLPKKPPDSIAAVIKIKARQKTAAEQNEKRTVALDDPDKEQGLYLN